MRLPVLLFPILFIVAGPVGAQRIVYSEPDKEDSRRLNFEIVGKVDGNFLIYKNIRNKNYISVYNSNMEQTSREDQEYMPDDRIINVDFFAYPGFD